MVGKPQLLALVRHGQSEANVSIRSQVNALYYSTAGSDTSVGLTEQGKQESIETGRLLSRIFSPQAPIQRIYLSPYLRVRQTVEEIERRLGYQPPLVEDKRLQKRSYGRFWNVSYRGVEQLFPEEFARFRREGPLAYRPPDGENYPDVFARVQSFIDEVINPSSENLLVASHSIVVLAIRRAFELLSDEEVLRQYEDMTLPNGHVTLYSRLGPGHPWKPLALR